MTAPETEPARWRKSSYSGGGNGPCAGFPVLPLAPPSSSPSGRTWRAEAE
ncbi:DUF397 domain-containing protein [Streptomyces sp. SID4926]|nr:DUF397 domain-containing protein [Streptomyces sp. SID4926]MYR30184.1 DUF397 domain-containing protein [Streptomyces sp. SID4945]